MNYKIIFFWKTTTVNLFLNNNESLTASKNGKEKINLTSLDDYLNNANECQMNVNKPSKENVMFLDPVVSSRSSISWILVGCLMTGAGAGAQNEDLFQVLNI